ncbi:hypothetical protein BDV95DRAFT_566165 [Massariosphaeria phaeospora]|uniref:Rhodopsin domain-containing protein n=1 Tax=Massariosphaeria phaeospora TaxID=100035 RepID=A0A7C8IJK9_9PLEO|nr:hypothetical protein BDV95DRAFT_566165 [Massariosphaeria phaeospora]
MPPHNPRGRQAVDISGAFTGIAAITVLLRLYTRFFVVRRPGIEDYFITLAMLCSVGLTICIAIQVQNGMGRRLKELAHNEISNSLKAFWASLIVYYLSLGLTKISILVQYRRVFTTRTFQIVCWCTMAGVGIYSVWTIFGSIFACVPVRAFWAQMPAKCIDHFAMWFANAAVNIVTDFTIIMLPMPVIRGLNLARRQKQLLVGVFAIGGFVCIVSIIRLQSLVAISKSFDPTYDNPPAATWSSVEINVGIICSCLPCLRPLIARCLPGVFSHDYSTQSAPPYRRHDLGTALGQLDPEGSRISSHIGSRYLYKRKDIQVVTEVSVHVEDTKAGRESSTETLVRNVGKPV